jgi:MarR family transcriptional regulator, 2-MHQ and catechol-resistance regulon repressor
MSTAFAGTARQKLCLETYIKLQRSAESVNRRIDRMRPLPDGMTTSQFAVLEALLFHGSLKQADIAKKILKTQGNLTMVIDNLVKAGLVERQGLPEDRRVKLIHLTTAGEAIIEQVFPRMADAITDSLSVLTDEQLRELSALLRTLGLGNHTHQEVSG